MFKILLSFRSFGEEKKSYNLRSVQFRIVCVCVHVICVGKML